jgi:hypothetical protein
LPVLGSLRVAKLTAKRIEDWHHDLAEKAGRNSRWLQWLQPSMVQVEARTSLAA